MTSKLLKKFIRQNGLTAKLQETLRKKLYQLSEEIIPTLHNLWIKIEAWENFLTHTICIELPSHQNQ